MVPSSVMAAVHGASLGRPDNYQQIKNCRPCANLADSTSDFYIHRNAKNGLLEV